MGQRGVLIDVEAGVAGEADLLVGRIDERFNVGVGDAGVHGVRDGAIDEQRCVVGQTHAVKLVRLFNHAAAGGDGRGAGERELRIGAADTVREHEGHVLVEADCAGGEAAIAQRLAQRDERAFVLLPGDDFGILAERAGVEQLARAAFFKCGADKKRFCLGGNGERPEALAAPHVQFGKVDSRCALISEHDGVDFVGGHECFGALDARLALGVGEGARFAGEVGQCGNSRRQPLRWGGRCLCTETCGSKRGGGCTEACGKKSAAREGFG